MNWVKNNWVPLAVGFAAGYVVSKHGGLKGTVSTAKTSAKRVTG